MTFYWWEDARDHALELAEGTRIKHKVHWTPGGWSVDLADSAVMEPCS